MNAVAVTATVASGRRQLVDVRRRLLLTAQWRGLWVLLIFAGIAACAVLRILFLGLFDSTPGSLSWSEAMLPNRGEIVDRNGVPLARAFPAYALWYNPNVFGDGSPLVKTPREVAEALVNIFPDEDVDRLTALLAAGKPAYLRRRIMPEDANRIHELGEPALEFPRENERFYPQGSMAAHVLGFVSADGKGQVGMEQVFNQRLTDPDLRGTPAMLSIDARVQGALEEELMKGIGETNAKGAAGVVLDVDTGEVMALASLPSFNPNLIDNAGAANIFNRVTNQVYELGSVVKPVTIASAIDAGVVTNLARRYPSDHPLQIGGFQIHDSHNFGPSLNVPEALIHSSNIVTAQVADELGGDKLRATMEALGFNERPYIELPARGFPIWPRGEWARITTMTVSYGHGVALTPLHLACAYAALVNGGIWRPATLEKIAADKAPAGRRVFKASTSARIRQLLRMIVQDGTGRKANAPGFRVGGKTGTAEKPSAGGYRRNSVIATLPLPSRWTIRATSSSPCSTSRRERPRLRASVRRPGMQPRSSAG
jgi:cell division protein FtsI (penicillin-binding protein 3)